MHNLQRPSMEILNENEIFSKVVQKTKGEPMILFITTEERSCYINWRVDIFPETEICKASGFILGVYVKKDDAIEHAVRMAWEQKEKVENE